jgi:hypothetical protein
MNRLFLSIIAMVLTLSTIYQGVGLRSDEKVNSVITDLNGESEGEIEAIDLRLFVHQTIEKNVPARPNDPTLISYSEKFIFVNFLEVLIPPPKF